MESLSLGTCFYDDLLRYSLAPQVMTITGMFVDIQGYLEIISCNILGMFGAKVLFA